MIRPYRPKNMPGLTPYITSPNPESLRDFLGKAYGFEQAGQPMVVKGKVSHIEMMNPDCHIMIGLEGSMESDARSPKTMNNGAQGIGLYVYVPNVDEHFKRADKAGAKIIMPPNNAFWGDRIYATEDCDGNRWTFGQNFEDFNPSKIPK